MSDFNYTEFVDGYIVAALWADCMPMESEGPDAEHGGCEHFLLADGARERMIDKGQLVEFVLDNVSDLARYTEAMAEQADGHPDGDASSWAGHDLWLTRNGHGAGFWDRGLGALGERLSEAAKGYGSADDHTPYVIDRDNAIADA